jgi:hypothetical protein
MAKKCERNEKQEQNLLWKCKESEREKRRREIQKEIWTEEKEGMKKLVDYGFYQGIC